MSERIDRVVTPPGLIARARTWTVIWDRDGMYLLCTGNATREVRTVGVAGALARKMIDKIAERYDREIEAAEARLATMTPADYVAQDKHSVYVARAEIKGVELRSAYSRGVEYPLLIVQAAKKYRLHLGMATREQAEAMQRALT
ncbi:MAG: hypothetical protein H6709_23915 [Kofleriaceae bacterium]|nr:hypothetical protein [Myxococcales bacterium]MCB9559174.1 hypothetical protein [Kofleriaceae bacterium]MCB9575134.1 hypothetical protein [Kofleriaceae bacterium]